MARLFRLADFWRLFPQSVVKDSETAQKKRVQGIVMSLINGNVSIRAGHYITKSQMAEKRKKILQHKYI